GGSDTTAVALAIALKADRCEILTDVDGVYSADPRIVKNAKKLDFCSYDEMLEMAWLGAKVLHPRSVEIAKKFDMPIVVASSFNNNPGTLIKGEDMEKAEVRAITFNREIAKVSIVEVPDIPGTAASVFELLSSAHISCSFIVQSQSHNGKNDITFTVNEKDFKSTMNLLENNMKKIGGRELISDINIATISVVGTGVVRDPRVASRVFKTLAACETNIDLISSSNITLTCVIKERDVEKAVQQLHKEFILNDETDVIE
ncbi:MAG TPA: aspartate kinase, partial [Candidatus Wallbacteria bacterium]|nr:aspartate kinase [Candidatus Wallbacteria bacterium]